MNAMLVPRALDADETRAFRLARLVAAEQMPYFMHALFAARPVAAPGLGTYAVDRHWRLYLDPDLLTGGWSAQVSAAVLLHETGHLLRDHAGRSQALPHQPYDHDRWNLAADAEINDDLLAAGVAFPSGVVTPAALGCDANGLAEDYYAHLVPPSADSSAVPSTTGGETEPGCGSGAGAPVPGEVSGTDAEVEGMTDAEASLVRRRVAQAVESCPGGSGRGTAPAGLVRWASEVLAAPTIPWPRVLRASVRRVIAQVAGRIDYTYSRPSRRRVPGVVLPAMRGSTVRVAVVVDTSGSMGQADLDAAMAEVAGVVRSAGVDRDHVHLVSCDAEAGTAVRVLSAAKAVLTGGGGTDMRVGIAAAEAIRPRPHVVVVLTDGYTPWPAEAGPCRLVCAVIRPQPPSPAETPDWAVTVHIPTGRAA